MKAEQIWKTVLLLSLCAVINACEDNVPRRCAAVLEPQDIRCKEIAVTGHPYCRRHLYIEAVEATGWEEGENFGNLFL
jgi:hypothetical protein